MQAGGRLHYMDWLRVAAFAVLILYHSAVAFFPDMDWLISDPHGSPLLQLVMDQPRAWRLALLFFISGMGTWFAFKSKPVAAFLSERANRLLVPLLFAMTVVIVPQVWYERMFADGYEGSLGTFWLTRYFTEGKYPDGNITWAHMWFVGYLLVMTVICVPIFAALQSPRLDAVNAWFVRAAKSPAVYAFFLLPLVLNLALTPLFPRQTNSLYNDGAWFAVWASWFGLGFLFAKHHAAIIASLVARRRLSAAIALLITGLLYQTAWDASGRSVIGDWNNMTPLFKTAVMALAWSTILGLVGFGARYINRGSAALAWLSPKIFPLYIVHQTVIVAAVFYVVPLGLPVLAKYAIIVAATVTLSLGAAMLAERLPWPLRALFGLADDGSRVRIPRPEPDRSLPHP